MTRKEINYLKCVIYKIVCNDLSVTDLYVGSTTDFTKRKSQHKLACKSPNELIYNRKLYNMLRENGGWENWSMVEIEKYPCNDSNESFSRERYWLERFNEAKELRKLYNKEHIKNEHHQAIKAERNEKQIEE